MTSPKTPDKGVTPRARARRAPGGKIAKAWRPVFLESLAQFGIVSHACVAAGVSRQVAYRARDSDVEFADAWETACEIAADVLEREAVRRAVEGVAEPVYYKGQLVGAERRYSDQLLMFLLRARKPAVFNERRQVADSSGGGITLARLIELAAAADEPEET